MWGVGPQGYQCADCELNIHRACAKVLEENCPGPVTPKRKDHQISKLMDKIRPSQSERVKRNEEDSFNEDFFVGGESKIIVLKKTSTQQNEVSVYIWIMLFLLFCAVLCVLCGVLLFLAAARNRFGTDREKK